MGKLSTPVLAVLAAALTAAASAQTRPQAASGNEEGFFRPSRDQIWSILSDREKFFATLS